MAVAVSFACSRTHVTAAVSVAVGGAVGDVAVVVTT